MCRSHHQQALLLELELLPPLMEVDQLPSARFQVLVAGGQTRLGCLPSRRLVGVDQALGEIAQE